MEKGLHDSETMRLITNILIFNIKDFVDDDINENLISRMFILSETVSKFDIVFENIE